MYPFDSFEIEYFSQKVLSEISNTTISCTTYSEYILMILLRVDFVVKLIASKLLLDYTRLFSPND